MRFRAVKKILFWVILIVPVLALLSILVANRVIEVDTSSFLYDSTYSIPHNKTGLLLGTSKYLVSGQKNAYFFYRTNAAVVLYQTEKIDNIVISGDNSVEHYNEPQSMREELLKHGVPDSVIYLDYAGFRTYDSVIRMNKIFGQTNFTIISQKFHNQRAVYIARYLGLDAIAYNAEDVSKIYGVKTRVREHFARVKMFLDLWTNKQPKFLGKQIKIK